MDDAERYRLLEEQRRAKLSSEEQIEELVADRLRAIERAKRKRFDDRVESLVATVGLAFLVGVPLLFLVAIVQLYVLD